MLLAHQNPFVAWICVKFSIDSFLTGVQYANFNTAIAVISMVIIWTIEINSYRINTVACHQLWLVMLYIVVLVVPQHIITRAIIHTAIHRETVRKGSWLQKDLNKLCLK